MRRCLRKRGWVELDYYKNKALPSSSYKVTSFKHSRKVAGVGSKGSQGSKVKAEKEAAGESSGDDEDSDVDLDLGLSDEEYEDEEEYTLVVSNIPSIQ